LIALAVDGALGGGGGGAGNLGGTRVLEERHLRFVEALALRCTGESTIDKRASCIGHTARFIEDDDEVGGLAGEGSGGDGTFSAKAFDAATTSAREALGVAGARTGAGVIGCATKVACGIRARGGIGAAGLDFAVYCTTSVCAMIVVDTGGTAVGFGVAVSRHVG
jgi:hypothetical protein